MRQAVHWLVAQMASRPSFYRTDRVVTPDDQFRSPVYIYIYSGHVLREAVLHIRQFYCHMVPGIKMARNKEE